ncbi:MAG: ribosome maturation factor RimP [Thermaurantimonas sp.]
MSELEIIKNIAEREASLLNAFIVSVEQGVNYAVEILADTDSGIRLNEIISLSRAIVDTLPDDIAEKYSIEVSSPGIGRPLILHRQYVNNVGRLAQISLKDGSVITGRILNVSPTEIEVEEKPKNQKKGTQTKKRTTRKVVFSEILETKIKVEF